MFNAAIGKVGRVASGNFCEICKIAQNQMFPDIAVGLEACPLTKLAKLSRFCSFGNIFIVSLNECS